MKMCYILRSSLYHKNDAQLRLESRSLQRRSFLEMLGNHHTMYLKDLLILDGAQESADS